MINLNLFYLPLIPIIHFSALSYWLLAISFVIGLLLFLLFKKSSQNYFLILMATVFYAFMVTKPQWGIDLNLLPIINSERGEHSNYQSNFLAKIIHNKLDLLQSVTTNLDKTLSPKAIFAAGFWKNINPYYPLGYLFPWDLFFFVSALNRYIQIKGKENKNYFLLSIFVLLIFTSLFSYNQSAVFYYGIIFFIAILCGQEYKQLPSKLKIFFIFLNLFYLVYQYNLVQIFRI